MDDVRQLNQSVIAAQEFLSELTELSRKYGIAINSKAELFEMELPVDFNLEYGMDAEQRLLFV
jgi:hypothetical protein